MIAKRRFTLTELLVVIAIIAIHTALCKDEAESHGKGRDFGHDHRDPDAVRTPDQRQCQHADQLKQHRPQEGDERTGQAVIHSSKER